MALPIKDTPILRGQDAKDFIDEMNRERTPEEKAKDKESYLRAKKVYDEVGDIFEQADNALPEKATPMRDLMRKHMGEFAEEAVERDKMRRAKLKPWKNRLKMAKDNKEFTEEDKELASLWITCPISEVADRIELKKGELKKGPMDIYLLLDGLYFTKGVEEGNIDLAQSCYDSIQKQAEALENGTDRVTLMARVSGKRYDRVES